MEEIHCLFRENKPFERLQALLRMQIPQQVTKEPISSLQGLQGGQLRNTVAHSSYHMCLTVFYLPLELFSLFNNSKACSFLCACRDLLQFNEPMPTMSRLNTRCCLFPEGKWYSSHFSGGGEAQRCFFTCTRSHS